VRFAPRVEQPEFQLTILVGIRCGKTNTTWILASVAQEPSRQSYMERGRFEQPDRTNLPAWSHPIIANGKLYVRDQDTLLCYDIKAK
jgi:hypothetical protein